MRSCVARTAIMKKETFLRFVVKLASMWHQQKTRRESLIKEKESGAIDSGQLVYACPDLNDSEATRVSIPRMSPTDGDFS